MTLERCEHDRVITYSSCTICELGETITVTGEQMDWIMRVCFYEGRNHDDGRLSDALYQIKKRLEKEETDG